HRSWWGHLSMAHGFPGFLARFHDAARDPGKPRSVPVLPGEAGRLVLLDALGDHRDGFDPVETSRVLPEQLPLDGDRHPGSRHELERLPGVLRVVMRVV